MVPALWLLQLVPTTCCVLKNHDALDPHPVSLTKCQFDALRGIRRSDYLNIMVSWKHIRSNTQWTCMYACSGKSNCKQSTTSLYREWFGQWQGCEDVQHAEERASVNIIVGAIFAFAFLLVSLTSTGTRSCLHDYMTELLLLYVCLYNCCHIVVLLFRMQVAGVVCACVLKQKIKRRGDGSGDEDEVLMLNEDI